MIDPNADSRRRVHLWIGWLLTALVVTLYFALPDGGVRGPLSEPSPDPESSAEPQKLDVVEVSPADANPGSAITIAYVGALDLNKVEAFVGKEPLTVLTRRDGWLVARLPADLSEGRVKIRVTSGEDRSKPYDIRIEPTNWRRPFRSLLGGLALLLFGIAVFARAAPEATGRLSARVLGRLSGGPLPLLAGSALGALAQSTTAAAGVLAALVSSSLLAVGAAASAFLGAQVGAASLPLLIGLIDPRGGLLIVALGVLWLAIASDRRTRAVARLVLGAGLIAFGLQTLRPGFEPFIQHPKLVSFVAGLGTDGPAQIAICASLGVALVALFQGPAPVVALVLVLARTAAHWELRTALAVLSGSGLGSAVGALLTTPQGQRGRLLAELYLVLGCFGTLFTATTIELWADLADWVVPGIPRGAGWDHPTLVPNLALHLGIAFALSQLVSSLLLLPAVAPIKRFLERLSPGSVPTEPGRSEDVPGAVHHGLLNVLSIVRHGVSRLSELTLEGHRDAGGFAEHRLADAQVRLDQLLSGPVVGLPGTPLGGALSRVAFSSLGFLRSVEAIQQKAQRLTDWRFAIASGQAQSSPLPQEDLEVLSEMHGLIERGLSSVIASLETKTLLDQETVLSGEIRLNRLEALMRARLGGGSRESAAVERRLAVLELVDAYEASGNQLYRLSEALSDWCEPNGATRSTPSAA